MGNLRLVYEGEGTPVSNVYPAPVIVQENAYYPFGLAHTGTDYQQPNLNNFQYNGKEKLNVFGLNWSDYGFRSMDFHTARFISIDPLATSFPHNGTYNYAENRPINGVDLEGLEYSRSPSLYDPNTGKNNVNVTLRVKVTFESEMATNQQSQNFLAATQKQFSETFGGVYDAKSNTQYSGKLIYDNKATISLAVSDRVKGSSIAGLSIPGASSVTTGKYDGDNYILSSEKQFAVTAVHELIHQGMGGFHPFDDEKRRAKDVTLIPAKEGGYNTTENTDKEGIYSNIMMYGFIKVDGKTVNSVRGSSEKGTKLSPNQMQIIIKNIDRGRVNGEPMKFD